MANKLPTRRCDGCGQIWSSGSFLDPTSKADCGYCGEALVHRRRLPSAVGVPSGMGVPNGARVEVERLSELEPAGAISSNGASAPVAPAA